MTETPKTIRAHKIKLNPTAEQAEYFAKCAGIARFCFNWSLARWKEIKATGQKASFNDIKKEFRAKIDTEFPFAREVASCVIDEAVGDVSASINRYYKTKQTHQKAGNRKAVARLKFPGWRKRRDGAGGFAYTNIAFKADGHSLKLARVMEAVNMAEPVRFPGKLMSCRITRRAGDWYASITMETDYPKPSEGEGVTAVHFGLRVAATISNGEQITQVEPPRFLIQAEHRLAQLQLGLSSKVKGSANWQKQKRKIGKAYLDVANARAHFQHTLTHGLVHQSKTVVFDQWEVQNLIDLPDQMWQKEFYDAGIATIAGQLGYKGKLYSTDVIAAKLKASKTCSTCGAVNETLKISQKKWECPDCGAQHDREINAVINNRKYVEAV